MGTSIVSRSGGTGSATLALVAAHALLSPAFLALALLAATPAGECHAAAATSPSPEDFAREDRSAWLLDATTSANEEIADAVRRHAEPAAAQTVRPRGSRDALDAATAPLRERPALALSIFFAVVVVAGFLIARKTLVPSRRGGVARTDPPIEPIVEARAPLVRAARGPARDERAAPPPRAAAEPGGPPNGQWGRILRLASSGVPGEEIARRLGASIADVELVIALERKRAELAGRLAGSAAGGGDRA